MAIREYGPGEVLPPATHAEVIFLHQKRTYKFTFKELESESDSLAPSNHVHTKEATISNLADEVAIHMAVPPENQKWLTKLGLLKYPFKDPELRVSAFSDKKVTLMGSTVVDSTSIQRAAHEVSRQVTAGKPPAMKVKAYQTVDWKKKQEEALYTFTTLRPLPYLPNPGKSLAFLERLKNDAGIKASMRKHKFTVPLLTEMNPIEHTQSNHEGTTRTLGLNRNQGEVIELRLRTDAYDGYRDYKTIRKTLCHELAHNVHGPHDRKFWDLCKQIEKEVEGSDWKSGGHSLGDNEYYGGEDVDDHGGWTGGEFTLGGERSGTTDIAGLSRSEIIAKAAEARAKEARKGREGDSGGSTGL